MSRRISFCSNKKDLLIKMNTMSSLTLIRSRSLALAMKNMNKQLLPLSHLPSALCSFKKWSFQKKTKHCPYVWNEFWKYKYV